MTKSYKATPFWVDMYDKGHTLFVCQIYNYFITNSQKGFCKKIQSKSPVSIALARV